MPIRPATGRHAGTARFGAACRTCPLAARCTTAKEGRTITIGPHEARLAAARQHQRPGLEGRYRATRPKVERKISHLMRRRHGGRRARVRGLVKVAADFALLAAAVNLARLGVLGVAYRNGTWRPAAAETGNASQRASPAGPGHSPPAAIPGPHQARANARQRSAAVLATYDGAQHTTPRKTAD